MPLPRTIERLVDDQARRLDAWHPSARHQSHRPLVALTRLPGSDGDELARRLCMELDYELYDQRLIHEIAVSSHHSDRVVATLDESARSQLTQFLTELMTTEKLSPHDYRYHLSRIVGALARRGAAVVMGRGAHLILRKGEALRVLVVAPLDHRAARVAARDGISAVEAHHRIVAEEAERRQFLKIHFHAELADPASVDIVVNTEVLGVEGALDLVRAALGQLALRSMRGGAVA